MQRNRWGVLIMAILLAPLAHATAEGPSPGAMQTGSLLLRVGDGFETATLLNTDVNITVNGLVAHVSVMQEFRNDSSEWVEGVYVFPLPDAAAVNRMRLYIGDRFIEGEIREKEQARKEYERAKASGKRSSLVEQQRANLFTTSVANIAAGETVVVEIEYLEDLRYDSGTFRLRFPMTLTPRYSPDHVVDAAQIAPPMAPTTRGHRIALRATVNAGMPLEIVASRYHAVHISEGGGVYVVELAGGRSEMDRDFELLWRPVPSAAPRAMLFSETIDDQPHYLLMVVPPGSENAAAPTMAREIVFIVDTSGSMHGESMRQARQALQRAIDALQPGDMFNVIEFNSVTRPLFPASVTADPINIDKATRFASGLTANGGTEMYPALDFALRTPASAAYLRQMIFITDGAVGNEESLFKLIDARLDGARLFTVGIGSAPNSWFMRKAAEAGRGAFTFISALHEVGEKMDRLFRKLEHPQVTNIEVQWPSGVIVDSYPAVVPDLYLGEPVVVRARASGLLRPGDSVRIVGNSMLGAWSAELPVTGDNSSPGVAALWGRSRIADLEDRRRRGADADATRAAIVATAMTHHLVSRYTSLVAVDKTPARVSGDPLYQQRLANRTPAGQLAGFPATATSAELLRLTGLASLLLAALVAVSRRRPRRKRYEPLA